MASIFIRTFIIYILLTFSLRLMGKRQIGELDVGELISTLLISEIASLPIADPDIPLMNAIIPLGLIVSLEIIISSIKNKSEKLKHCIEGEPIFIIYKGKLIQKTLYDNRISINELLCQMRMQNVGDISDVYYAILEQNGKISVLKKSDNFARPIIIDEEIIEKNLSGIGKNEKWLYNKLKDENLSQKDIFLMTVDDNGDYSVVKKEKTDESK